MTIRMGELLEKIKPAVLGWIDAKVAARGGGDTVAEGPDIDIVLAGGVKTIGRGGDAILLFHASGEPVHEEAATDAGLDAASALFVSASDRIEVPQNANLATDHLLAACQYVFHPKAVVSGKISLSDGTVAKGIRASRTANDGNDLFGIVGPLDAGETAYLLDCHALCAQSGAGRAAGLVLQGGDVKGWDCKFNATSVGGVSKGVLGIGHATAVPTGDDFQLLTLNGVHVESMTGDGNHWEAGASFDPVTGVGAYFTSAGDAGGFAQVIYDLGQLALLDTLTFHWQADGDRIVSVSPDGITWTDISTARLSWAGKTWATSVIDSWFGYPGPYRYIRMKSIQLDLIGRSCECDSWTVTGSGIQTTWAFGSAELLYCQMHGDTHEIDCSVGGSVSVYADQYDPEIVLGNIVLLKGDRAPWIHEHVIPGTIVFGWDGGGSALAAPLDVEVSVPYGGTLAGWRILADQVGSATIDIRKSDYANYPPTVSICGGSPIALSDDKNEDVTLAGWSKTLAAGDILLFHLSSVSSITRLIVVMTYLRS